MFLSKLSTKARIKKQLIDLSKGFYCNHIYLPPLLHGILQGNNSGFYGDVFKKRDLLLNKYYDFMKNISSEYSPYDIIRWTYDQNKKWRLIRHINKSIFL